MTLQARWVCMQGPTRGDRKDASTTWCEDINGDFGRGGAAGMMPSSIENIRQLLQRAEMSKKNIYLFCNVKQLEKDFKLRCKPHLL